MKRFVKRALGFYRRKRTTLKLASWEVRKLARRERQWQVPLSTRRPRWWMRGFLSRSAVLYDLDEQNHAGYLSDFQRVFRAKRMVHPQLQEAINNKWTAHLLLTSIEVPCPELLGLCSRGRVHSFPGHETASMSDFLMSLPEGRKLFFKALAGAEGKNIHVVAKAGDGTYELDSARATVESIVAFFNTQNHPFIIEVPIPQHEGLNALYAGSVNTIRALTMPDVTGGDEIFIVAAVQRIGSNRSKPSDNWSRGGLSAPIDLDTGTLGRATRLPDTGEKEWFTAHPDTGAPIEGVELPLWEETKNLILSTANKLSFMEYIGWDIALTPDGPIVLEANINSGVNVFQTHGPLLLDPRVRAYYASRNVKV